MAKQPTAPQPAYPLTAGELSARNIGSTIRFRTWDQARELAVVITAELRQISHDGDETHINYSVGAEAESTLTHNHRITVHPPADYTDMPALLDGADLPDV